MRQHFSIAPPESVGREPGWVALWYNKSGKAGFIEKRLSGQRPFLSLRATIVFPLGIYFMV